MKEVDKISKNRLIENADYSKYFADRMAKMGIYESSYPQYISAEDFGRNLEKITIKKTSNHISMSVHSNA
jgi:hypothetical protein